MIKSIEPRLLRACLLSAGFISQLTASVELTDQSNFSASFEPAEGYASGYLSSDPFWSVGGSPFPFIGLNGFSGSQGIELDANSLLGLNFTSAFAEPVGWIDFYVKPAFGPSEELPDTFPLGQAALTGFVKVGLDGSIYVLNGDGLGNGEWIDSGYTVSLTGNVASDWLRMTYRLDYTTQRWDLFLNNQLQIIDIGFVDSSAPPLSRFHIQGALDGLTQFDQFEAGFLNPLYLDTDNDGMSDTYELAQGLDETVDDRILDSDFDSIFNIEEYMAGLYAGDADSDGDGVHDGLELQNGANPLVADAYSLTAVPFTEDFESLTLGTLNGSGNWQVSDGFATVTADTAFSGVQSLEILGGAETTLTLENYFDGSQSPVLWTELMLQPVVSTLDLVEAEIDDLTTVVFYFSSETTLVAYDGSTEAFSSYEIEPDADDWKRITVQQDYSEQTWSIWCDGTLIARNLGFANKLPYFYRLKVLQESAASGFIDDLSLGFVKPLQLDSDKDGNFDELEDVNLNGLVDLGETDPFKADTDDDGIIDSVELLNGLNPTVADTVVAKLIEQEPGVYSWSTSFDFSEGYIEAALDGQNGWAASSGSAVSSAETGDFPQLIGSDASLEQLIGAGFIQKYWISFEAKLAVGQLPDGLLLSQNANALWGFGQVDELSVWNSLTDSWDTYDSLANGDEWNEYAIYLDYISGTWKICQNGVLVADALRLDESRAMAMARLRFFQEAIGASATVQTASFDVITISTIEPAGLDFDGDLLPNEWERANGLDPLDSSDALLDADEDGLSNAGEYLAGTDPRDADSDGDTLLDGFEVANNFAPLDASDVSRDTDGDLMLDWWEITYGLDWDDPSDVSGDLDMDLLSNYDEYVLQTNPADYDTDSDGYMDGWEVVRSYDPKLISSKPSDFDHDGVFDHDELIDRTDPNDPDSYLPTELFSQSFEHEKFLINETGDTPIDDVNFQQVTGFIGNGISSTDAAAVMQFQSEGNFSATEGTLAFWFQPEWNSGDKIVTDLLPWLGLVEIGEWTLKNTPAYLGIVVHRNTRQLGVILHDGTINVVGGNHVEYFTPINWKQDNWYHLTLSYNKESIKFYIDSKLAFEIERPEFVGFANPIRIPASSKGVVDELKLYNFEITEDDREVLFQHDSDRDGLWDQFEYNSFGDLAYTDDLTADSDGDGLINRLESEAQTNGNQQDTDGDGILDYEEVIYGISDPLIADTDGDGLRDGLEHGLTGFDPLNSDSDGDGIDDFSEFSVFENLIELTSSTVVSSKTGLETTARGGAWIELEGRLCPVQERGRATYTMSVPESGIYLLEVNAYQNNSVFSYVRYDLEKIREVVISVNGLPIGESSFNRAYGHDGTDYHFTPWLEAGDHTVEVYFSEILFSDPVFAIDSLKLRRIDEIGTAMSSWEDALMAKANIVSSESEFFYSPAHIKGQSRLANQLPVASVGQMHELWDSEWYLSLPLNTDGSITPVQLAFEESNYLLDKTFSWVPLNLLEFSDATLHLPVGTVARFKVENASEPTAVRTFTMNGMAVTMVADYYEISFAAPGIYNLSAAQGSLTKQVSVTIRAADTGPVAPKRAREDQEYTISEASNSMLYESSDKLELVASESIAPNDSKFTVYSAESIDAKFSLRDAGLTNSPLAAVEEVSTFDLETVAITYMRAIERLPDGTLVVQNKIMGYNLPAEIKVVLDVFVAGVVFEEGGTYREVSRSDFDEFGVYAYNILIAPGTSVNTPGCHRKKLYLGDTYLGDINR